MISRYIILCFVIFITGLTCAAQTPEEVEQQMDEIKMNEAYIYGEDYNSDMDMAYHNALTELLTSINELRSDQGKDCLSESDIQTIMNRLGYTKADRNVAFVYLPMNKALTIKPGSNVGKVDVAESDLPRNNNVPVRPPKQDNSSRITFVPNTPQPSISNSDKDILETLCSQDNWAEIKGFIISFKREGKIRETGNCRSFSEVPNDAYSILMDDMGGILSIMSPKNSPTRVNHKTNRTDNETNHANCKFIVWYR